MNRSKVKDKRRYIVFLKGILARKSWPIDAVVGADWWRCGSDFHGRHCGSWIGGELVLILLQRRHNHAMIAPQSCRDRATIARRSWSWFSKDCLSIVLHQLERSWPWFRDEWATIAAPSHCDRGLIAPQLLISSTSLPSRPMEIWCSMRLHEEKKIGHHW